MTEDFPVEALVELKLRRQAEDDFYTFVKLAWPHVEGGRKFVGGWAVRAVAEHLEEVYYGRVKRLLVNISPRCSKSTLICVMFPVWCWIKDCGLQFCTISYAEKLAKRDNVRARRLMKSRWFQTRWGDRFQISEDQDTKERVDNMQGGYRIIAGLDGSVTGDGGDILIADDLNNVKDRSEALLDNALEFYSQVLPTRYNNFKMGRLVVVQQRMNEKDVSGHILNNQSKEFVKLILPMEFEENHRCVTIPLKSTNGKPWQDPREKDGELMWPERFGPVELASLKNTLRMHGGEYAISGQLQQRPAPAEGGKIKRAWFQPWRQDDPPRIKFVIQAWDTAATAKDHSAYSACTTWGLFDDDHGNPALILLSVWRKKVEFPELYKAVQRMARDYRATTPEHKVNEKNKPDLVLIEDKSSGVQLIQTLNKTGVILTPWNPDKYGDKEMRVERVTHILEAGRVFVPYRGPDFRMPKQYADFLISQAAVWPKGDSRDLVDTMTMVLQRVINSGWVLHPLERQAENQRQWDTDYIGGGDVAFY